MEQMLPHNLPRKGLINVTIAFFFIYSIILKFYIYENHIYKFYIYNFRRKEEISRFRNHIFKFYGLAIIIVCIMNDQSLKTHTFTFWLFRTVNRVLDGDGAGWP